MKRRQVVGFVAAAVLALLGLVGLLLPSRDLPLGPVIVVAGVLAALVVQAMIGRPR